MLKNVNVCVGTSFGDEGKGHITDILCSRNPGTTVNVRFNGGAQASHTVVTPDGKRYAFRHFGAGTFTGVPTYLSEDFLVNIYTYDIERCDLSEKFEIIPKVFVNPKCRVTTIWDMNINQMVEKMRGDKRHGSCGLGINETVHRSKYPEYCITVMDLLSPKRLREKLEKIQNEYIPRRLKNKYGIILENFSKEDKEQFENPNDIELTLFYATKFVQDVLIMKDDVLNRFETAVFEGAQGLMLDQGYEKFWPNVTTSNTGIRNVMKILRNIHFKENLDIYYISRCYATRHGRGLFPTETAEKPYKKIIDLTNVPNEFQENLRFGILDIDLIIEAVNKDLQGLELSAEICMILTCFDQVDDKVLYKFKEEMISISKTQFLKRCKNIFMHNISQISNIYVTERAERGRLNKI